LDDVDGPTHRYIGASPACWDLYTRFLAGSPSVPDSSVGTLLVDAYAAQHPGDGSSQATQSVAVHLVVLEAVLGWRTSVLDAVPLRAAAVNVGRQGSGFAKLEPVPDLWDLTLADVVNADPGVRAVELDRLVSSVWSGWKRLHGAEIEKWHAATVALLGRR
jgi:hypothetical protein